jgi:hypothetical protein
VKSRSPCPDTRLSRPKGIVWRSAERNLPSPGGHDHADMSNVWATKHRLHVERCEALVGRLSGETPTESAVLEEQTVRLLLVVFRLLVLHDVDKRGRCRSCRWSRRLWRFRRRTPQCTVFREVELAFGQEMDVVWWQLLAISGRKVGLDEIRKWVHPRE